jgi:hypothetical protein
VDEEKTRLLLKLKKAINLAVDTSCEAQEILEQLNRVGVIHIEIEVTAIQQSNPFSVSKNISPYNKKWPKQIQ